MTTVTTEKKTKAKIVAPFTIEADNPRNCDLWIQSIPGCRMRSRSKPTTPAINTRRNPDAEEQIRTHTVQGLSPPSLPGMLLKVDPAECVVVVADPLKDDEIAQERMKKFIRNQCGVRIEGKIACDEDRTEQLGQDEMKTLCREIVNLVEAGDARVVQGPRPEMVDVDDLPGDYVNNIAAQDYTGPRYEKNLEEWKRDRALHGG